MFDFPDAPSDVAARFGLPELTAQQELDLKDRALRSLARRPWRQRLYSRLPTRGWRLGRYRTGDGGNSLR